MLGYAGYVLLEAKVYQAYQARQFEAALEDAPPAVPGSELPPPVLPSSLPVVLPPEENKLTPGLGGELLGRIEIGRVGLKAMIMAGIDSKTLRRAVGHIPGTAPPGQPGNVALAGHRDTFFRELRNVRLNDEITLTTLDGVHRYRVESALVVGPREMWVLKDTGEPVLTLVTCYPFNYVGPAPQRFIVRAQRISGADPPGPAER